MAHSLDVSPSGFFWSNGRERELWGDVEEAPVAPGSESLVGGS
jgi:hypothetical protein